MAKYKFSCGCEFDIVDEEIKSCDGLPGISIDYYNLPDCPITWNLIDSGRTKGVFQLETGLGQSWAKRIQPASLNEMAALVSLLRPGCLRAIVDGKSMTQHYCDRKSGIEEVEYFHDALTPILQETYAVLVYQEQAMRIAQDIAGFNLQDADVLRKATGKKDAALMAKVKKGFLKGCEEQKIVNKKEAEEIFGWIQESQRYSFNKSHGVSYGDMGYMSAYVKAHFPLHFYTSWLYYSHEKMDPQQEMKELVSDAKNFDININPPCLKYLFNGDYGHFSMFENNIYFGIEDIKKIGKAYVEKILNRVKELEGLLRKPIQDWTWYDFLIYFSDEISNTAVNNIVAAGATDYMGLSRSEKIHQYNLWRELTKKEREWLKNTYNYRLNLVDNIERLIAERTKTNKNRQSKIRSLLDMYKNNIYCNTDTDYTIAIHETELLGIPLTRTALDLAKKAKLANTTCSEILKGKTEKCTLAVEITKAKEHKIKNGKLAGMHMAFLSVEDRTGTLDNVVIFPEAFSKYQAQIKERNTVLMTGQRDYGNRDSFIISEIKQI